MQYWKQKHSGCVGTEWLSVYFTLWSDEWLDAWRCTVTESQEECDSHNQESPGQIQISIWSMASNMAITLHYP